ncbi:MAG: DUF2207 domain-containing protein, partial [Sulfurovum sp.]|nr:DUF2207 domain-containing protein [Sulfurovum sp.]
MLRIFLVLLLTLSTLFAEKITHFHIDMTLEPGGGLAVTETIDYHFETTQRHGIFRDIPSQIKYKGIVKDIGLYDFTVEMDGHPVNWQKSTWHAQHAGEIIRLKIGDAATLLSGEHRYTIQYRVKKGVLPAAQNPRNDAVRWNIVGTGWGVPIYDIRATFHLPENLTHDHIALSTYTGRYGATATNAQTQWRDDRTLEVYISHLEPYEGATVELAFPAGILGQSGLDNVEQSVWERFLSQWHWAALVGYLLYFFEARKKYTGFVDKRSVAVQYLPPKGLSLLQSGLLLDKHADNKDFAAAILELAQLGYIEIEQPGSRTDPILKRTDKLPKGLTKDQQYLLAEVLFPGEKKHFVMKQATPQSAHRLKTALDHINTNLYTWSVEAGYMAENPQKTRKHFLTKSALLMLPVAALTFYTLFRQMGM